MEQIGQIHEMSYWLSKRRIKTRVRAERGCLHRPFTSFGLIRCPACREMYLVEYEFERLYSRRGLRKTAARLGRFWVEGCLACDHIDSSDGCRRWDVGLEEVRASWWRWALPARLRLNRKKRAHLQRKLEAHAIREKSHSKACDACFNGLFPDAFANMA